MTPTTEHARNGTEPAREALQTLHSLEAAKLTALLVLGLLSALIGLLPVLAGRRGSGKGNVSANIRAAMLHFGGGVLLCVSLLHLLPEVCASVDSLVADAVLPVSTPDFAGELLLCVGFFMMCFIEEAVHTCVQHPSVTTTDNIKETTPAAEGDHNTTTHDHNDENHHSHMPQASGSIRSLFIVSALSIHELFEGLSIGLETEVHAVWFMLTAVATHKYVIALCIGFELVANKTKLWLSCAYIAIFSGASSTGIGLGMIVSPGSAHNATLRVSSVVLQGMAAGTLIYVVFFEILNKQAGQPSGLRSLLSVLAGFSIMLALLYLLTD